MQTNNNQQQYRQRINHHIRVPQIRVILADGSNGGIMNTQEALKLAQEQFLDLVEINPKAVPPVCRIVDHGKLKYEEKKKAQVAKRSQSGNELKELTFRPFIADNDLAHKLDQAKEFLTVGCKVKFTIKFKGREITHPQIGRDKINLLLQGLSGLIVENPQINLEGKFMSVIISPAKLK